MKERLLCLFICLFSILTVFSQPKVLCFYSRYNDPAHLSFIEEANTWFNQKSRELGFQYDTCLGWSKLNTRELKNYQLILFLDSRPEDSASRKSFERYMEQGGAWIGFHFAGFALTPSDFNDDWNWYHHQFLGSGAYKSNTWRPTGAYLKNESPKSPFLHQLKDSFWVGPNEWYRWENNLRKNKRIQVLLSIHPASYPLGTGPKPEEIWHEGDYPVVWTNKNYRMLYINMGHNDMDYSKNPAPSLSHQFNNSNYCRLVENALAIFLKLQKR